MKHLLTLGLLTALLAAQPPLTHAADYYESSLAGARAAAAGGGKFIPIAQECMVRNTSGNCGFCSIEICARHLGYTNMRGFAVGKGGCTSSSMASWLNKYGVKFKNATSRAEGVKLMQESLAADVPVLFSIPGHALVCNGWTNTPELGERIWVVDNTGREGCQIKGWTKSEFDRRFDGWVCALFPLFPGRSRPPATPPPGPPTPHVDPTPDLFSNPLQKRIDELETRLKNLEKGDTPGHATLAEKLKNLEGKVPELLTQVQTITSQFGGVQGILQKTSDDLPRLAGVIDQLKKDGLLTDAKASKAHEILDKVVAGVGRFAEVEKKIEPIVTAVPWGTILGSIGSGAGGLGLLLSLVMGFARARAAAPAGQDPLALILSALHGLKQAPVQTPAPVVVHVPAAAPPVPAS